MGIGFKDLLWEKYNAASIHSLQGDISRPWHLEEMSILSESLKELHEKLLHTGETSYPLPCSYEVVSTKTRFLA